MKTIVRVLFVAALLTPGVAFAQQNPLSGHTKFVYGMLKQMILKSAEKMPEENYKFKPTEVVRSYGQVLLHVADGQYRHCSAVLGEAEPAPVDKTKESKKDVVAALETAFAYCDKAYGASTDVTGAEVTDLHGMKMPRLGILQINNLHTAEHYGNLVTYMRMKGIVPPSSEPGFGRK